MRVAGSRALERRLRGHVDDPAAAPLRQQPPNQLAAAEERAGEVHLHRGVPVGLAHVLHVGRRPHAGAIDQDVRAAKLRLDGIEQPHYLGLNGYIASKSDGSRAMSLADLLDERQRCRLASAVVDGNLRPLGSQPKAARPAQAAGAAGDEGDLVGQVQVHGV